MSFTQVERMISIDLPDGLREETSGDTGQFSRDLEGSWSDNGVFLSASASQNSDISSGRIEAVSALSTGGGDARSRLSVEFTVDQTTHFSLSGNATCEFATGADSYVGLASTTGETFFNYKCVADTGFDMSGVLPAGTYRFGSDAIVRDFQNQGSSAGFTYQFHVSTIPEPSSFVSLFSIIFVVRPVLFQRNPRRRRRRERIEG